MGSSGLGSPSHRSRLSRDSHETPDGACLHRGVTWWTINVMFCDDGRQMCNLSPEAWSLEPEAQPVLASLLTHMESHHHDTQL